MTRIALVVLHIVLISACAELTPLSPPADLPTATIVHAAPSTFIHYVSPEKRRKQRLVNVNNERIALADALSDGLPGQSILPMDEGVDLTRMFAVRAIKMPTSNYLAYLSAISGYDIELDGSLVRISSMSMRSWDLAFLATHTSGSATVETSSSDSNSTPDTTGTSATTSTGSGNAQNTTTRQMSNTVDAWNNAIGNARSILRLSNSTGSTGNVSTDALGITAQVPPVPSTVAVSNGTNTYSNAWLAADRRTGTVYAVGPPQAMRQLDRYFSGLVADGTRQITLKLTIVDVVWKNSVSQGVDWSAVFNDGISNLTLGSAAQHTLENAGRWAVSGTVSAGSKFTIDVLLEMLRTNARTYTITRPTVTLLNGESAFFRIGENFRFISNVSAVPDQNGNVIESSEVEAIGVGMGLFVSGRFNRQNRIVMDLAPNVTNITGFRTLSTGGTQSFETPITAPLLLATKVISRSGQPVFVAGLTSDKLSRSIKGLSLPNDNPLSSILSSSLNESEHREVLFILTPYEVRS